MRLSPEQQQEICDLYENGSSAKELAERYGCSDITIIKWIKRGGGVVKRQSIPAQQAQKAIALYNSGKIATEIAEEISIGTTSVYRILKKAGINPQKLCRRGERKGARKFTLDEELDIVERYQIGESLSSLMRAYNLSNWTTIRNVLKRHDIKRRKRGNVIRDMGEEERAILLARWTGGAPKEDILKELGTSHGTMNRWLKQLGFTPESTGSKGRRHYLWKGGRSVDNGYILLWMSPEDPLFCMANSAGYVREHRLVMANHLGRPLTKNETVHHINDNKKDNRIDNLQLRIGNHGTGTVIECAECQSNNISEDDGYLQCLECDSTKVRFGKLA